MSVSSKKKPELCNICKQKMLKSNFFSKNKHKEINKKKEKKSQTFSKKGYKFVKSFFQALFGYFIPEAATRGLLQKQAFLKISQSSQENKRPQPSTLLKQRLWHRFFPVNLAKFLRTPFLQKTSGRLLLSFSLHINLIYSVLVDLVNKRQQETHGFLGKKSESHGINLLRGQ